MTDLRHLPINMKIWWCEYRSNIETDTVCNKNKKIFYKVNIRGQEKSLIYTFEKFQKEIDIRNGATRF